MGYSARINAVRRQPVTIVHLAPAQLLIANPNANPILILRIVRRPAEIPGIMKPGSNNKAELNRQNNRGNCSSQM